MNKDLLINEQIPFDTVSVIEEEGSKPRTMKLNEAIEIAENQNLDLVLVSNNKDNPICKILDYSKYKFEMNKRAKEAKKKQKIVEIKEVRLSPNIDTHDLEVKIKMASKFISDGNKVKVSMKFRGRELNFVNQGKTIMENFKNKVENCQTEKESKLEGKNLVMFLSPKQSK